MEPNPGVRGYLLLRKALVRHREGTFLFHQDGTHEQSTWNKDETRVKAHYLPFLKPHGTAVTSVLSTQTFLKYAVLPVRQVLLLLLSQSLHKRCPSPFSLARGQLFSAQSSYFEITVPYSSKIVIGLVLSLFMTLTL